MKYTAYLFTYLLTLDDLYLRMITFSYEPRLPTLTN